MSTLAAVSTELADAVAAADKSVVRVDDGTRLTASGVIWADGIVVATSHGVEQDENVFVELADGTRLAAEVVGRDAEWDIAVLRVHGAGLPVLLVAESSGVRVGQLVLALGRPGTAGLQATVGIVSAFGEADGGTYVHTDAVFYPGFSGGALVDTGGKLVGLVNLMMGRGRGIAVGASLVRSIVEAILTHGTVQRGYLGVRTQPASVPTGWGVPETDGMLVVQVEPDSPAEKAGVFVGDMLLSIDGHFVADSDHLRRHLRTAQAGNAVKVRIVRGGQVMELGVTLGAAPR